MPAQRWLYLEVSFAPTVRTLLLKSEEGCLFLLKVRGPHVSGGKSSSSGSIGDTGDFSGVIFCTKKKLYQCLALKITKSLGSKVSNRGDLLPTNPLH